MQGFHKGLRELYSFTGKSKRRKTETVEGTQERMKKLEGHFAGRLRRATGMGVRGCEQAAGWLRWGCEMRNKSRICIHLTFKSSKHLPKNRTPLLTFNGELILLKQIQNMRNNGIVVKNEHIRNFALKIAVDMKWLQCYHFRGGGQNDYS